MSTNGNGNGKWMQWTLNALLAVCLAVGGWIYSAEQDRHLEESRQLEAWKEVQRIQQSQQDTRIAVLEAQYQTTNEMLKAANAKLDRLLAGR